MVRVLLAYDSVIVMSRHICLRMHVLTSANILTMRVVLAPSRRLVKNRIVVIAELLDSLLMRLHLVLVVLLMRVVRIKVL